MANNLFDSEQDFSDDSTSIKPFGAEESEKNSASSNKIDWSKIDWSKTDNQASAPTDTLREFYKTSEGELLPVEETIKGYVSSAKQPFQYRTEEGLKKGITYRKDPATGEFKPVPMDLALKYLATGAKWAGLLTANPILAAGGALAEEAQKGQEMGLGSAGNIAAEALVASPFGTGAVIPKLKNIGKALNIGKEAALVKTAVGALEGAGAGTAYTLLKSIDNPDEMNDISTNALLFAAGGALGGGLGARSEIKSIDNQLALNLRRLEASGNPKQVTLAKQLLSSNTDDALKIAENASEEALPFKKELVEAIKKKQQSGGTLLADESGFAKKELMTQVAKTTVSAGAGVTVGLREYKQRTEELDPNALQKAITLGGITAVGTYAGVSYLPKIISNPKKTIGSVLGPEVFISNEFKIAKYFSEAEARAWKTKASGWAKEIDGWIAQQPNPSYAQQTIDKIWKSDPNERVAMPEWQNLPNEMKRIIGESSSAARKFSIDIASFVPKELSDRIMSNVGQYSTIPYRLHASDDLREAWKNSDEFIKAKAEFRDELINVMGKTDEQADEIISDMVDNKDWLFGINRNSTGTSVTGILTSRQELTPKAKAMLGEITEPGAVIAATLGKQADLVYANQWEKNWSEMLLNTGLATRDAKEGLVRLVDDVPFRNSNIVHKNFDGLWVKPHILESLKELRSNNLFGSLTDSSAAKFVLGTIGVSKATKTIGNFAYNFVPQLLSNTLMSASSGSLFFKGALSSGMRSIGIQAWDSPFTKVVIEGGRKVLKIDKAFLEKSLFDAQRFGILENNITVADMMTDLQFAFGKGDAAASTARKIVDTSSDIFSMPDRLLRQVTWEGNIAQIKNIDPRFNGIDLKKFLVNETKLQNAEADELVKSVNKLVKDGKSEAQVLAELEKMGINTSSLKESAQFSKMFDDELIKREAAIVTHNEFPNPIFVPNRLRQLSAISAPVPGVGYVTPFVMIPFETTRNMWNQTVRGAELVAEGTKTGNLKMVAAGTKKLAMLAGVTAGGYTGVKMWNYDKFGLGDKEDRVLNDLVQDYDKNKPLLWTEIDPETKEAKYVASDLIIPYNNQAEVAANMMKYFENYDEQYLKNAQQVFLGMFGNDEYSNTVVRPAIEAIMNINIRTGNKISTETGYEGVEGRVKNFLNASFTPGLLKTINDVVKANKGYIDPFTGKEYTTQDVVNRILGYRETSIKLDRKFENGIDQINQDIETEKNNVQNALYKIPDIDLTKTTPQELLASLSKTRQESEIRSNVAVQKLSDMVNSMKSLTVKKEEDGKPKEVRVFNDGDIVSALERRGVDKAIITQLLTGEPVKPLTIFSVFNTVSNRLMEDLKSIATVKGIESLDKLQEKIISYGPFANYEYPAKDERVELSKIAKIYNDNNDAIINMFLKKDYPEKQSDLTELINQRNIMVNVLEEEMKNHIDGYYSDPDYKKKIDEYNINYFVEKLSKAKNVKERVMGSEGSNQ